MPWLLAAGSAKPLCAQSATTQTSVCETILRVVSRQFMLT
jgi:hypothetical protein